MTEKIISFDVLFTLKEENKDHSKKIKKITTEKRDKILTKPVFCFEEMLMINYNKENNTHLMKLKGDFMFNFHINDQNVMGVEVIVEQDLTTNLCGVGIIDNVSFEDITKEVIYRKKKYIICVKGRIVDNFDVITVIE